MNNVELKNYVDKEFSLLYAIVFFSLQVGSIALYLITKELWFILVMIICFFMCLLELYKSIRKVKA
jgi:hypothetical protein